MAIKIVGVGNPFRRDDCAGIVAARILKTRNLIDLEIVESNAEPATLMTVWSGVDTVIVLDAAAPAGRPGHISRVVVGQDVLPAESPLSSTHAFGLAKAIELAEVLGELPPTMIIFAIEGADFDHGEGLSESVQKALPTFVDQVVGEVANLARMEISHA